MTSEHSEPTPGVKLPEGLRILYAAGPGDVIGTYQHWKAGRDDPSQVAITYSGQFYDFCREHKAHGYIIAHHHRSDRVVDGDLILEHRPLNFSRGPGWLYHLEQIWYGIGLAISAARFRANVAVVAEGTHWFVLGLMRWFGIAVVPTLHCVLWPKNRPPRGLVAGWIWDLNARFFRTRAGAILSLSNDITQQLDSMIGSRAVPIVPFLPSYRRASFGDGLELPKNAVPFRVFFAGRIERNKGVFDLLEASRQLKFEDFEFDLCGEGSQLETLEHAALAAGLESHFRCHGHGDQQLMREMYQNCHVVIVPTSSTFVEGFNKVVAEGVLAGRPVVASSVCPALEYVRPAVVEVAADDVAGYVQALRKLKTDKPFYDAKQQGCAGCREAFYDLSQSWKAALERAISVLK